jgi:hypothetical protein
MSVTENPFLLLGHPGHELRIYGWLRHHAPDVWILTNGAGASAAPRIELSRRVLHSLGLKPGAVFGAYGDLELYAAILRGDRDFFIGLASRLAQHLLAGGHTAIVSDAAEGYNPTHDLCQLIAASAAERARRQSGRPLPHYTFLLDGPPAGEPHQRSATDLAIDLDEPLCQEKIQAAMDYARTTDGTLLQEVQSTLARFGPDIFRHERLLANAAVDYETQFLGRRPFYEEYGERRARAGQYQEVIRYQQHMIPLARALRRHALGEN